MFEAPDLEQLLMDGDADEALILALGGAAAGAAAAKAADEEEEDGEAEREAEDVGGKAAKKARRAAAAAAAKEPHRPQAAAGMNNSDMFEVPQVRDGRGWPTGVRSCWGRGSPPVPPSQAAAADSCCMSSPCLHFRVCFRLIASIDVQGHRQCCRPFRCAYTGRQPPLPQDMFEDPFMQMPPDQDYPMGECDSDAAHTQPQPISLLSAGAYSQWQSSACRAPINLCCSLQHAGIK